MAQPAAPAPMVRVPARTTEPREDFLEHQRVL